MGGYASTFVIFAADMGGGAIYYMIFVDDLGGNKRGGYVQQEL